MTYDYHGSWEKVTGHNSPLFQSSYDSGNHIFHNIVSVNPKINFHEYKNHDVLSVLGL